MERQQWVDSLKALGIFLVFYGHLVERVAEAGSPVAFLQFKAIYAFHMPLFFLMAGFFWRKGASFPADVRTLALRRLLPVLLFGALVFPLWAEYLLLSDKHTYRDLVRLGLNYLKGKPSYNIITWFLVCLFTCEVYANALLRRFPSPRVIAPAALLALAAGVQLGNHRESAERVLGVGFNTWYLHEAVVALGFYLLGHLTYPFLRERRQTGGNVILGAVGLASAGVFLWSLPLNSPSPGFKVMMVVSLHGLLGPFLLTALAGSAALICLARLLPPSRLLRLVGRNTLVLLGLNGVFHHFYNTRILHAFPPPADWLPLTAYCALVTLFSLLCCVPAVFLFNRLLPQLVGKPQLAGPLLPQLETREAVHAPQAREGHPVAG